MYIQMNTVKRMMAYAMLYLKQRQWDFPMHLNYI